MNGNKVDAFYSIIYMKGVSMSSKISGSKWVNPHLKMRSDTSARALYSSHRSCFGPTPIKKELTLKQQEILKGTAINPRKGDVNRLINKLQHYERYEDVKQIKANYPYLFSEDYNDPDYETALQILENLTPKDLI